MKSQREVERARTPSWFVGEGEVTGRVSDVDLHHIPTLLCELGRSHTTNQRREPAHGRGAIRTDVVENRPFL